MAYKIKSKKEKIKFDEKTEYYLVDIAKNTYDNHLIKGWKSAVRLNLAYQLNSDNPNVVPMPKVRVLKLKFKKENFLAR